MSVRPAAHVLAVCLCACSATRLVDDPGLAQPLGDGPDRYIIAGIDNDLEPNAGHAASTPRGYDLIGVYGPSSRAVRQLAELERAYGLKEVRAWPIAPLHMHCAVLAIPPGADRAALLAELTRDPRIRIAQPLQTFTTQSITYNDPYVALQRGFAQMDVPDAHALSRGEGVRVAIIDTGVDALHPDLGRAVVQRKNFVDSDAGQFARDRHGTELAGIIAAVANNHQGIVGVAPGVRLYAFKACWQLAPGTDAARCDSFTLARALSAAIETPVQIVNLSLSGPPDALLQALIVEGMRRGILFVGAAPPDSTERLLALDGVIRVAPGGLLGGSGSPLRAPGREILTLLPGGRYDFASGASLATAHVTGALALLLAQDPRLTAAAAYTLFHATSVHVDQDEDSVDACEALSTLMGRGLCRRAEDARSRVAMH